MDNDLSKPAFLYHGMRNTTQGNQLELGHEREINGVVGRYLFATPYLSKVMMFAFDWHAGEAILGGAVEGTDDQYIVICERSKTLQKPISLFIYELPSDNFKKCLSGSPYVGKPADTREYYSHMSVPLSQTRIAFHISSIDELMRHGLQIFSTEKSMQELKQQGFMNLTSRTTSEMSIIQYYHDFQMTWENRERKVNVNHVLDTKL